MTIEVLYFAEFKDITGKSKEEFEIEGKTIGDLVSLLLKEYPRLKGILWDEKNQVIHSNISVVINRNPIHNKEPHSVKLSEGDSVAFLLPVSGG
ncbi:MAG: MoaD/ThiS family protein [Promethearchaeota archaeon]